MGVFAKILGAHGSNVAATLAAVYLAGRLVDWIQRRKQTNAREK